MTAAAANVGKDVGKDVANDYDSGGRGRQRRRVPSSTPPLLLDQRHRMPVYVCCVHDPHRRSHRVFVYTCSRPRGRAASAPQTYATLRELQKAMRSFDLWPAAESGASSDDVVTADTATSSDDVVTADAESGSSRSNSTSSSSHTSQYLRASTLASAGLTHAARDAIAAYAKAARVTKAPCTFTLVFEPVLRMATVRVWLHRVATAHVRTTLEDAHTFVDLTNDADLALYAHDLLNVVLATQGSPSTRVYTRQQTLRTNVGRCSGDFDDATLADLDRFVARCTRTDDHPVEQELLYQRLVRVLGLALKQAASDDTVGGGGTGTCPGPCLRQRIELDDRPGETVPFDLCRARGHRYGFVHRDAGGGAARATGGASDRLMADMPSTVVYATQTSLACPGHSLIDTLMQSVATAAVDAVVGTTGATPKHDDFLLQTAQGKLRAHLNRSRLPVQLYQLYNQLQATPTFPVLALYHQTPGLARRVLRTQYHETGWTKGASLAPNQTVLDAYLHYIDTQNSTLWLEQGNPDVAHFLDVVVYVKPYYYLCVLDRTGAIDLHLTPWHTSRRSKHVRPTASLGPALQRAVRHVLPIVNRWIRAVNRIHYPTTASPLADGVRLSEWAMRVDDEDRVYAAPHVHLQAYTGLSRFGAPRACVVEALRALGYAFLPSMVTTPALQQNPPSTLRQLWTRLGHGHAANQALYDWAHGRVGVGATDTDTTVAATHALHDGFYRANNRPTPCTLLLRSGCARFGLADRTGYAVLKRGVPLRVNLRDHEAELTLQPSPYQAPPASQEPGLDDYPVLPLHPSVLYEFAVLLSYTTHRLRHAPSWRAHWPALRRIRATPRQGEDGHATRDHCPIPVVAAPHGDRLKNIKATIGEDLYKQHVAKCSKKGNYSRLGQKANQPWCVPATTTASFRRWCRYACVPPEHDYWMQHSVRERLRLHKSQTVYRGPYRVQYPGHKVHAHLVYNLFKMQHLAFAESACDVVNTTLLRLIAETYRRVHPHLADTLPTKAGASDIVLEWFKRAVKDTALLRRAMALHHEVFPDEPLASLSRWNHHYGKDAAAWRMWVHLAQRFARTLYYLPHPFLKTASRDTIHFCCPVYICRQCKVPMAGPETPACYYADPPSDADLRAALAQSATMYDDAPIVSLAVRKPPPTATAAATTASTPLDYPYGDVASAGVTELEWAHTTTKTTAATATPPSIPKDGTASACYGPFGTVLTLDDTRGRTMHVRFLNRDDTAKGRGGTVYEVTCAAASEADDRGDNAPPPVVWSFRRLPGGAAASTTSTVVTTYAYTHSADDGSLVVTTVDARPREQADAPPSLRLPATFTADVHAMAVEVPTSDAPLPRTTLAALHDPTARLPVYWVVRTHDRRATLVHRHEVPLCARFRQFRAIDPLKTLWLPEGLVRELIATATVTLTGVAHYESTRVARTQMQTARHSRTKKRQAKRQAVATKGGGRHAKGRRPQADATTTPADGHAHHLTATLGDALRRGWLTRARPHSFERGAAGFEGCALTLSWRLCGEWSLTLPNASTYDAVLRANRERAVERVDGTQSWARAGAVTDGATRTMRMRVNDDRLFQCPRCGVCNHSRTFFKDHGAKYGQIAAIKHVPSVGTDPNWLYVSSFKASRAKLDPRNYERHWNRKTGRAHEEYCIPLGITAVLRNTRAKAFNCNVQKVARTDTFTIQSFNLHTLLEAPAVPGETTPFLVTGTVAATTRTGVDASRSTLLNLWQCLTEEVIDDAWLDAQLTPTRLLNLAGGRLLRGCGGGVGPSLSRTSPPSASSSAVAARERFARDPALGRALARTKAYLKATVAVDTGITGDLLYWWEWMATLGYDTRSRLARNTAAARVATPLAVFMLDVRQTQDGTNFAPRTMAPPHGDLHRVIWDPYADEGEGDNETVVHASPLVLFSVVLKVLCRATYADAFYVLRSSQRASAAPLFVSTRARVRAFLDEGVTTFAEARARYRKSTTYRNTETEWMYECALLYCKLYKALADSVVYRWYPDPRHVTTAVAVRGAAARVTPTALRALVEALQSQHKGYSYRGDVTVDPRTHQIRHCVFHRGKTTEFRLPVAMDWTDACAPVASDVLAAPQVDVAEAMRVLATLRDASGYTEALRVRAYTVDAFGRVTALRLAGGGDVPVAPTLPPPALRGLPATVDTGTDGQYACAAEAVTPPPPHERYVHLWEDMVELCGHMARHFSQHVTALNSTCRREGSTAKPCLLYRLREQVDAMLDTPPSALPRDLRRTLQTNARYVRVLRAVLDHHVLYAEASTVREMILSGHTHQLVKLFQTYAPRQTSADDDAAVRAALPHYDFPAARTTEQYERQYRAPVDTLFHTLLKRHEVGPSLDTANDAASATEGQLCMLPAPWRDAFPNARLVERDGFTVLAESTSVQKAYLALAHNKRVVPLDAIVPLLRFPVHLLNDPRGVLWHAAVGPSQGKAQSPAGGPVVLVRPLATAFRAELGQGGREVHTPDVPPYILGLWRAEPEATHRRLHIVVRRGSHRQPCTVEALRPSTTRSQWHTLVLRKAVAMPAAGPSGERRPAADTRTNTLTWSLDPAHHHVARYLLVKQKVPHKSKLKTLGSTAVETVLGQEVAWSRPPVKKGRGAPRYWVVI